MLIFVFGLGAFVVSTPGIITRRLLALSVPLSNQLLGILLTTWSLDDCCNPDEIFGFHGPNSAGLATMERSRSKHSSLGWESCVMYSGVSKCLGILC